MQTIFKTALCLGILFAAASFALSAEQDGPESVAALLNEQTKKKSLDVIQQWSDHKAAFAKKTGFAFGLDYTTQLFASTGSLPSADNFSGGAIHRAFGRWDLINRGETDNNGSLNWKFEHRHRYTDVSPRDFSRSIGHAGAMAPTFNDDQLRLTQLYWRQTVGSDFIGYLGYLYAPSFVDAYEMVSPWTGFTNYAFETGSGTMALPRDSSFGVMMGMWLTDNNLYAIGSIIDRNGDPTDPFRSIESFFDDNEYFTSIELGWSSSRIPYFKDNVHVTFWHVDEATSATPRPDGWGLNFSASHWINDEWLPFLRAGYADDGGSPSLLEKSVSAGVAFHMRDEKDLVGIAANWGKPAETTYRTDLNDQFGVEAFYRMQLLQGLAVTPSVQLLFDPALNPEDDFLAVFGLRGRVHF